MKNSHDISAGAVRLDFGQLFRTVNIAVGLARCECERALSKFQHASLYGNNISGETRGDHRVMFNAAKDMARAAEQLAVATQTLDALEYSRTREDLFIENRPALAEVIPLKIAA